MKPFYIETLKGFNPGDQVNKSHGDCSQASDCNTKETANKNKAKARVEVTVGENGQQ